MIVYQIEYSDQDEHSNHGIYSTQKIAKAELCLILARIEKEYGKKTLKREEHRYSIEEYKIDKEWDV